MDCKGTARQSNVPACVVVHAGNPSAGGCGVCGQHRHNSRQRRLRCSQTEGAWESTVCEHRHQKQAKYHAPDMHIPRLGVGRGKDIRVTARWIAFCSDAATAGSFSAHAPSSSLNMVIITFKHEEEGYGCCFFKLYGITFQGTNHAPGVFCASRAASIYMFGPLGWVES